MEGAVLFFFASLIVIFVHELGHAIAFRLVGIPVIAMNIGIPRGPRIPIRSTLLRSYFGPNFILCISPLLLVSNVTVDKLTFEGQLSDSEKSFTFGAGVIANILLYIALSAVVIVIEVIKNGMHDMELPLFGALGKLDPVLIIAMLTVSTALIARYARFVSQWIFPILSLVVLAVLSMWLWKFFADSSLVAQNGISVIFAHAKTTYDDGQLVGYVGTLSLIFGLCNIIPLYPFFDGGFIGMLHVKRFVPKLESFYTRIGNALILFLFILLFVPDLYHLFLQIH